jgi:hypothetical protein
MKIKLSELRKLIKEQLLLVKQPEWEKKENVPPTFDRDIVLRLINKFPELKSHFLGYKKQFGRRYSNLQATEIIFKNYILNDSYFTNEYQKIYNGC